MSRTERSTRVVLAGVVMAILFSLIHGSLGTISMLWDIAISIALLAVLSALDTFWTRRRKAKGL